jgi:hypothetical protein
MGGSDRATFTAITRKEQVKLRITTNFQSATSSVLMILRLTAHLAHVAAYSYGRRSGSNRNSARATGSASSSISKMRSRLSIRGMIRGWWRFTRTEAAVSPASANAFNACKAESNRSWREEGDRPFHQESAFSLTTLLV